MFKRIINFISDVKQELKNKVSWSSYTTVQHNANLVIIGAIIITLLIGGINFSCKYVIDEIYKYF